MQIFRRDFVKFATVGVAGTAVSPLFPSPAHALSTQSKVTGYTGYIFDVRAFGAVADGKAVDTPAFNKAIDAAAEAGGGTVHVPAGVYLCYSIRLKSRICLHLAQGSVILGAPVSRTGQDKREYDAAESNSPWEEYQDYGHNHWHNSLIWGEGLHDVSIIGPGLIWGENLSRGGKGLSPRDQGLPRAEDPGVANKALALKSCHNVTLRDFSILQGGHMGILATAVDNLTIDNLKIDTNRDAMNIDCCWNVRISNCSVNSPWDDGICLKSSFSLGYARATENVTIANCYVTGAYEMGTMLDGSYKKFEPNSKNGIPTGRIKLGTSSNGGFKNIAISNCVFDTCRGLSLECVDGGQLEDIMISGITMRNITTTPIFLRLGSRLSGPKGITTGTMKRITISNVVSYNSESEYAAIVCGIPGHLIEDVKFDNIYLHHRGGGTEKMAGLYPPEAESTYPEPKMFGTLPAHGFFIRHARNIDLTGIEIAVERPDARPAIWLEDVYDAAVMRLKIPREPHTTALMLQNCHQISIHGSKGISDMDISDVVRQKI